MLDPILEKTLLSLFEKTFINGTCIKDDPQYVVYESSDGSRYLEAKDKSFHFLFDRNTGFTAKWGKRFEDDVVFNPFGPEIADIEITKHCSGVRNKSGNRNWCKFCYKSNTNNGGYMDLKTFKKLFNVLNEPKTLTQIAFGTGASLSKEENPDYWDIFHYCKSHGVTPNVTVADISKDTARKMVKFFGACAVSYYPMIDKNRCYDSVQRLVKAALEARREMKVNIHCLLAVETFDSVIGLLNDVKTDKRLQGLNAVVFLSLKQKGRGKGFTKLNDEQFSKIINKCIDMKIPYGMDSCSANKFLRTIEHFPNKEELIQMIEPCEATCFSSYFDCDGTYYPCSFMEYEGEWKEGIKLSDIKNFKDFWYEERVKNWRAEVFQNINKNGCNKCKFFNV